MVSICSMKPMTVFPVVDEYISLGESSMSMMKTPNGNTPPAGSESEEFRIGSFENEGGPGLDGPCTGTPEVLGACETQITNLVVVILSNDPMSDGFFAHHRDIPELRVGGPTPGMAIANLIQDMTTQIECMPDRDRRQFLNKALREIQAFASRCG